MISPIFLISCYLLIGGATGQDSELSLWVLQPSHCQQTVDWCLAELQQTWSSACTCCSGCCTSSERPFKLPLQLETSSLTSVWQVELQKHHTGTVRQWAWSLSLTSTTEGGHLVIASFRHLSLSQNTAQFPRPLITIFFIQQIMDVIADVDTPSFVFRNWIWKQFTIVRFWLRLKITVSQSGVIARAVRSLGMALGVTQWLVADSALSWQ